ncbi:MAG: response regulator transcription factor [Lachnospiraceae bacterium]|nr:response regulator transcription factor [Lachnospiraceae bacterium]
MQRILIVDDEPDIQELLAAYLQDAGYETATAGDGVEALSLFQKEQFDLILLDLMMPKIDGFGVCELIRKESDIPVIMLTAMSDEANQLKGFELNIDDYVTKPFSMPVLLQKIRAVLRRSMGESYRGSCLCYRDLTLDPESREAKLAGTVLDLTLKEFELLQTFITNPGRVFTREVLLTKLWDYDFYGDERVVDTHVKNLRHKLGNDYIETVRGVGYRVAKTDA